MASSVLMDRLPDLCLADEPIFAKPFLMTLGSSLWTVATDRVWVVGVRGSGPWEAWGAEQDRQDRVRTLLACDPVGAVTVNVEDLARWAGPDTQELRPGVCHGIPVDVSRLAVLLADLPFQKVLVWDATLAAGMPSLGLAAAGRWKAVLAGLLPGVTEVVPPFDPRSARPSFDELMDLLDEP